MREYQIDFSGPRSRSQEPCHRSTKAYADQRHFPTCKDSNFLDAAVVLCLNSRKNPIGARPHSGPLQ